MKDLIEAKLGDRHVTFKEVSFHNIFTNLISFVTFRLKYPI